MPRITSLDALQGASNSVETVKRLEGEAARTQALQTRTMAALQEMSRAQRDYQIKLEEREQRILAQEAAAKRNLAGADRTLTARNELEAQQGREAIGFPFSGAGPMGLGVDSGTGSQMADLVESMQRREQEKAADLEMLKATLPSMSIPAQEAMVQAVEARNQQQLEGEAKQALMARFGQFVQKGGLSFRDGQEPTPGIQEDSQALIELMQDPEVPAVDAIEAVGEFQHHIASERQETAHHDALMGQVTALKDMYAQAPGGMAMAGELFGLWADGPTLTSAEMGQRLEGILSGGGQDDTKAFTDFLGKTSDMFTGLEDPVGAAMDAFQRVQQQLGGGHNVVPGGGMNVAAGAGAFVQPGEAPIPVDQLLGPDRKKLYRTLNDVPKDVMAKIRDEVRALDGQVEHGTPEWKTSIALILGRHGLFDPNSVNAEQLAKATKARTSFVHSAGKKAKAAGSLGTLAQQVPATLQEVSKRAPGVLASVQKFFDDNIIAMVAAEFDAEGVPTEQADEMLANMADRAEKEREAGRAFARFTIDTLTAHKKKKLFQWMMRAMTDAGVSKEEATKLRKQMQAKMPGFETEEGFQMGGAPLKKPAPIGSGGG